MKQILKWLLSVVIVAGMVGFVFLVKYIIVSVDEIYLLCGFCAVAFVLFTYWIKRELDKYL